MSSPDPPIPYLTRIREYYRALGYGAPYEWPTYLDVPFQRLPVALARCRVALITTAAPFQPGKGEQGPGAPYNALAKFYRVYSADSAGDPDLRISHVAIDRAHTCAEDMGSYFPLRALRECAERGRIGAVTPRFHGLPTNRSQRTTLDLDGPEIVARCKADGADAAILVANCPVCHQSVALAARLLEAGGIASVVMGCARDIVEHIGVPRYVFSDFPLGNAAGKPGDPPSQRHARNGAAASRIGRTSTLHGRVAAGLERHVDVEARLLQRQTAPARRVAATPGRVRRRQGAGERDSRRALNKYELAQSQPARRKRQ